MPNRQFELIKLSSIDSKNRRKSKIAILKNTKDCKTARKSDLYLNVH